MGKESFEDSPFGGSFKEQREYWDRWFEKFVDEMVNPPLNQRWGENDLRSYLIASSKGEDYLDFIENFPRKIHLSEGWHEILNSIRENTGRDGLERHIAIVADQEMRFVLLPRKFAVGERKRVPGKTIFEHNKWIKEKGYEHLVGSVHSHPHSRNLMNRLKHRFLVQGSFSAGDLYWMVCQNPEKVIGLVEGETNVFAFRTRNSEGRGLFYLNDVKGPASKQKKFEKFWYGRRGIIIVDFDERSARKVGGGRITTEDLWQVCVDIAEWHRLALYIGRPSANLIRRYP